MDEEDLAKTHGSLPFLYNDIDEPCFQQEKSKVLHLPGQSEGILKCGRRVTQGYTYLKDGASFKWARCTVCFKGRVITNPGDMADVMDVVRSGSRRSQR